MDSVSVSNDIGMPSGSEGLGSNANASAPSHKMTRDLRPSAFLEGTRLVGLISRRDLLRAIHAFA